MSVSQVAERSAAYSLAAATEPGSGASFDLMVTAPQGVAKLRELILSLAVRGKLVEQRRNDEPATVVIQQVKQEKINQIAAGLIKRDKSRLAITEDELPYELPSGWQWIRLGELLTKIGAGSTPLGGREVYTAKGVKFLRSQNVWNGGLVLNGVARIPQAVHERMSGTKVVAGDLLFNITGASIGRCALVPDEFDEANVSQHVTIIRTALASIRQFLHLVLISPHVQQTVMDVQVGVSREGLSIGKLGQFVIPLPPLAEQARIVARVEELMQLCDALEAHGRLQDEQHARLVATLFDALAASESDDVLADNWQRIATHFDLLLDRPEAVDTLEQTLLQLAVRGLLVPQNPTDEPASHLIKRAQTEKTRLIASGAIKRKESLAPVSGDEKPYEIPGSWEWHHVEDICSVVTDGEHLTPQRVDDANAVPLVTAKNVRNEYMDYAVTDFVPLEVAAKCWARCKPEVMDILMVSVGATLGRLSVLRHAFDMVLVRSVTMLRPIQSVVNSDYLAWHLRAPGTQREIWRSVKQSAQPCLYLAKSSALLIALPPLDERRRIVARIEQLRRLCADLRERLLRSSATQSQLADALVSAAAQPPAC
jgi:type I restriction enzyme S subunit